MSLKADLALNLHKDFIEQVAIIYSHDHVMYILFLLDSHF